MACCGGVAEWFLTMKTRKIDIKKVEAAFAKMVAGKRMIQDHVAQGKNLSGLSAKGIHFVKPVSLGF